MRAGCFLLNFLFQIPEQLRIEEVLNRDSQTIAEFLDRGNGGTAVSAADKFGVTEFIVGHYGGFDRLAARAVIEAKKTHPEVTLTLLLPYHPAKHPMAAPKDFDGAYHHLDMERVPHRVTIVRTNRDMANHVDYLIAYACIRPATHGSWWNMQGFVKLKAKSRSLRLKNFV